MVKDILSKYPYIQLTCIDRIDFFQQIENMTNGLRCIEVIIHRSVGIADAALGKEIEIPTLDGRVSLKIPEGTQTGKLFRLRGKGVRPVRSSMVGDLLCRIVVETPVNLNSRQRELMKELQASFDGDGHASSPKKKSFFDRLFD